MKQAAKIRDVNIRYHDLAADHYDAKWGIDFGEIGRRQVRMKLEKALDQRDPRFRRALEIGAGTGYFSLNLLQEGVIAEAVCTDISPGMLETLTQNAQQLGLLVETEPCDAEHLPFDDGEFDLVFGHAVLHHIPDLEQAFSEFYRVLEPGGTICFAGEPSALGDRIAALPKRGAQIVAPLWRKVLGAAPAADAEPTNGMSSPTDTETSELERHVDVHAFVPGELATFARQTGFERVDVVGEELLANAFGWTNRALEATADPADVPWLWRSYAFHGYVQLQRVDRTLFEGRLPAGIFYNLMIRGERPNS